MHKLSMKKLQCYIVHILNRSTSPLSFAETIIILVVLAGRGTIVVCTIMYKTTLINPSFPFVCIVVLILRTS
jgi:hypothetical protein